MLRRMVPDKNIEDCEMNANGRCVAVVNQLARQLQHVEHPGSDEIVAGQNQLNSKSGIRRKEFNSAHGVQTFHIECHETVTWIEDKMRVLEQTDELKMDLTGIMTLQHFSRLS